MAAVTLPVDARSVYLDLLTGKAVSNASYKLNYGNAALYNAAKTIQIGSLNMYSISVSGNTATLTNNALATMNAGTLAIAESSIFTADIRLTGEGGAFVASALNVTAGQVISVSTVFKLPLNDGGTLRINEALANAWLRAMVDSSGLPALANGGVLSVYSGSQPATADTEPVVGNVKLWESTFALSDYNGASAASATLAAAKSGTTLATGVASWARWQKGGYVMDVSVGTTGADFIVSDINMSVGNSYTLTAATLTFP